MDDSKITVYKSDDSHSIFIAAKQSGKQVLTPQQKAVEEYVNATYSSKNQVPLFKHQSLGISAEELVCLTLPPGLEENDKFVPCNVSFDFYWLAHLIL